MLQGRKYRIYPNKQQQEQISKDIGCSRFVYNYFLAESQKRYHETGKGLSYYGMATLLPSLKKENEWLKEANSQVLQQSLRNLGVAYQRFFLKRAKYPKFKKRNNGQSATYPQGFRIVDRKLHLPKIGVVKIKLHRPLEGELKKVIVSRNSSGEYYAAVVVNDGVAEPKTKLVGTAVGIDMGIKTLAVLSNGEEVENPKHFHKLQVILKRRQQTLARAVIGSRNREKARIAVAKVHQKIANRRKDHIHKATTKIASDHQVIVVEHLASSNMSRNRHLAKAIMTAGWYEFVQQLSYKSKRKGGLVIKGNRWYPSSKTCSSCGKIKDVLNLSEREWTCDGCQTTHDRDRNASVNILKEGLRNIADGTAVTASGDKIKPTKIPRTLVPSICATSVAQVSVCEGGSNALRG